MNDLKLNEVVINKLPKSIYIIGGSRSLKKQIPNFREPDDFDIMILFHDFDLIEFIARKTDSNVEIDDSKYSTYVKIKILKFSDGTKIDCSIRGAGNDIVNDKHFKESYIKIGEFNYFNINGIINFKKDLILNNMEILLNKKVGENKHLKDLIYLEFSNREEKYNDFFTQTLNNK